MPVESSCLYGYGAAAMHQEVILSLEYIRLDVYSERAMQEQGWGALADYWRSRLNSRKEGAPEFPGGLVEWVDSEHPPDPSLLIKLGDVMLEVGHWPPGSWPPSSERNRPIELAARHAFGRIIHLAGQDSGSSGEG